jgi:hypothetical protein
MMRVPDRNHGVARTHEPKRRVQPEARACEDVVGEAREYVDGEHIGVGGVIGLGPSALQPGQVGETGNAAGRREGGDEIRELGAVFVQHRRGRRRRAHELARHGGEEFRADQRLDDRERLGERVDQALGDVVAVDGETRRIGDRPCRIEKGRRVARLQLRPHDGPPILQIRRAPRRPWPLRHGASASRGHRCPIRSASASARCAKAPHGRAFRPHRRLRGRGRRSGGDGHRRCPRHDRRDGFRRWPRRESAPDNRTGRRRG